MGTGAGTGYPSLMGASETVMQSVEAISERILYWLSLNTQVAERLLQRFAVTVSDLPASTAHHDASTAAYIGIRSKSRSRLEAFSSLARRRSEGWYSKPISGRLEESVGMRSLKIDVGSVNPELAVLRIKIVLLGTKPPIWRRVLVPAEFTLAQLHDVVQAAMGWEDCHLHQFYIGKQRFGVPDPVSYTHLTLPTICSV